ncbi:NADPH-dependent FMN reductase [Pasteurellaceae bacterium 22721_9_1]
MAKQIAVLVGSNSKTSLSKIVVNHLKQIAPESLQLNVIEIADLPLYDRDLDENSPEQYKRFRSEIAASDGVLFVAPEHNSGVPAMIKNAIDVGSRPMGSSLWPGKPAGIVSLGGSGGIRTADQLRVIAAGGFINMPTLPFAANISGIFSGVFNEQGEIASDSVKQLLENFIKAYADFVQKF